MQTGEFKDTGNVWIALAFGVAAATGVGIILLVNGWSLLAWMMALAGLPGTYYFWPVDAYTHRRRAEERMQEEDEESRRAEIVPRTGQVLMSSETKRLTLGQYWKKIRANRAVARNARKLRKGNLNTIIPILAQHSKATDIDKLRYWNPLPSKVRVLLPVMTELAGYGVESLSRRARHSTIKVFIPPQPPSPEPLIVVSMGEHGVIGPVPDELAEQITPFLEAGGVIKADLLRVFSRTDSELSNVWVELQLSPQGW